MAGHSQFKNIMHRKGKQDKLRARTFARCGREISVATRSGGHDPATNPRLRQAILAARSQNMPKSNIDRAIQSASSSAKDLQELLYEAYGPSGTAMIIETMTDNKNRTATQLRAALNKHNGAMAGQGSVLFMFERKGRLVYTGHEDDKITQTALEAGASDVVKQGDQHHIISAPTDFDHVQEACIKDLGMPEELGTIWVPSQLVEPQTDEQREKIELLVQALEECEDVQSVSYNLG